MSDYWIAFGDIHNDISMLDAIPELGGAAGIIVTGDITFAGGVKQAEKMLLPLAERVPRLLAQIGNMDKREVSGWLEEKDWNLHGRGRELFPGIYAIGAGGSTVTPFSTPSEFSENELAEFLEAGYREACAAFAAAAVASTSSTASTDPISSTISAAAPSSVTAAGHGESPLCVLVSHTPPYASACDRLSSGGSAGSRAVRSFIEKRQPALCLCGHIHESRAEEYIGLTHVINPGMFSNGGYVVLRDATAEGIPAVRAELRIAGQGR